MQCRDWTLPWGIERFDGESCLVNKYDDRSPEVRLHPRVAVHTTAFRVSLHEWVAEVADRRGMARRRAYAIWVPKRRLGDIGRRFPEPEAFGGGGFNSTRCRCPPMRQREFQESRILFERWLCVSLCPCEKTKHSRTMPSGVYSRRREVESANTGFERTCIVVSSLTPFRPGLISVRRRDDRGKSSSAPDRVDRRSFT
jgi:hypothetical protein